MNKFKPTLLLAALAVLCISFHNFSLQNNEIPTEEEADCLNLPTVAHASLERNGKLEGARRFKEVFTPTEWKDIGFPYIDERTTLSLLHQLRVLEASNISDERKVGNLELSYSDLKEVIEILLKRSKTQPDDLNQYLEAHQVYGQDRKGNVYFTGYFTPALKVRKKKDKKYKYPIYSFPKDWKGKMPSRKEIDKKGALKGMDLEIGYAANPFDIYTMQLQGTGTVEFVDTKERMLFKYAGENGHPYRNIERFFRNRKDLNISNFTPDGMRRFLNKHPHLMDSVLFYNPSYTFFTPREGLVKGAGKVPLLPEISIAADPRYFPPGSVILAAVPVYDNGKISHHEYRLLLPQDVGGAVKGAGHVDVYCGVGKVGRAKASSLHHYGRMWILTPKKNNQVALKE